MKKLIHILLIFIILGAVTISGCKKDEPVNLPGSGEIVTTGTIEVPDNINKSGWSLISGLNGGTIRDNQYDLRLNKDAVQLVCVLDANGQPALMAIDVTSSQSSDHIISASTTAEALVFLNPFFCTSDVNEALELKQKIYTLSSFSLLVETINSQLQNGSFTLSGDNNELLNSLDLVYKDLLGSLGLSSLNKVGVVKSSEDFTPSPDFEINALKIVEFEQNSTALSFKVANRAKRWISVFVDKSVNGSTFEQSADPVDIIPSPSISIWNLITKGIQVPVENSQLIQSNTAGYKAIAVKCYGLGTYNIGSQITDNEFSRAMLPAACSAVFDLGIPVFEVITGMKFSTELRGRPTQHPFYKLVEKAYLDLTKDLVLKARIYTWYREGDIVHIVAEISKGMLTTCAKEPVLIADILTDIIGKEVARSLVNSWLFPIRVINSVITAANIGYSLGSILSTEAITDFSLNNTTPSLPVTIKGSVKSYSTNNPVSNAYVTSYNQNGNLLQSTITNAAGNFSLKSTIGYVRIRVVANGYKPSNQVLDIPSDAINQSPSEYYAPTTWLSVFSSDAGDVAGTVVDATTLRPVSGVKIDLRPGINDIAMEITHQTVSGSDGSFYFTSVPSGTYTAYFSKTGYINDYLVLSVLGDESTSGFKMNLSPDINVNGFRIVLTWAEDPNDLDSHLFTPNIDGTPYHIYYSNPGDLLIPPYASLDVDDVTSYGPETITIDKTVTGEYYYSVYHYAGSGSLTTTSNATVNLYGENGFIRKWTVPSSGDGVWWNVFSINGETGAITNINAISDYPPDDYKGVAEIDMKKKK